MKYVIKNQIMQKTERETTKFCARAETVFLYLFIQRATIVDTGISIIHIRACPHALAESKQRPKRKNKNACRVRQSAACIQTMQRCAGTTRNKTKNAATANSTARRCIAKLKRNASLRCPLGTFPLKKLTPNTRR